MSFEGFIWVNFIDFFIILVLKEKVFVVEPAPSTPGRKYLFGAIHSFQSDIKVMHDVVETWAEASAGDDGGIRFFRVKKDTSASLFLCEASKRGSREGSGMGPFRL